MKIGLLQVKIYLPDTHSFKDKRMKLSKLKGKVRKEFNVSITELEDRNRWRSVVLGILLLGRKTNYVNKMFDRILKFIKKFPKLEIVDYNIQMM